MGGTAMSRIVLGGTPHPGMLHLGTLHLGTLRLDMLCLDMRLVMVGMGTTDIPLAA